MKTDLPDFGLCRATVQHAMVALEAEQYGEAWSALRSLGRAWEDIPSATEPEMAAVLSSAKSEAQKVLDAWPVEVHGLAWLEQAIGLLGRCESELDAAAEELA